ncbi:DNA-directed RNA polymerase I subunit RPA43 isoform X3 [Puntigrus tetrazona]|uniref:DNA-directed RNA polymerase I subunit RPA43 isoform X3 n=1 Tax=Puntigrus tetrazona TaxID=1606681 RepID=UPI001C89B763|nr:DNA-directed RNA polymerase I subunit RPA43 isoform X3 [Puntigrus tetrazona]
MANWTQEDGAPTPVSNPADVSTAAAPVPCLVPSFADAVKLLSARYSCLVRESHRRHVALPPLYLQKKRSGIQEELNAELLKFSSSLKGVPMAYDNIKVVGQHGHIYDDQGFIHLNIEASFVVFKPRKGSKLVGVINKMGVGHVGCLVHGCFNASVVKPSLLSSEQWRESGLSVGQDLEFEVFQLDADTAGVLLIRGRLERSRVQELVARTEQKESTAESIPELESTEDTVDSDPEQTAGDTAEMDSNANGHHREKKKKKKKDEILPSDSSGYVSDKTSRKRAAESDGAGLQKKKKKKRST